MISSQEKNESENINIDVLYTAFQNNGFESSFENMNGEEEDEDDLLKSESETNKSSYIKNTITNKKSFNEEIKENNNEKNININKNNSSNLSDKFAENILESKIKLKDSVDLIESIKTEKTQEKGEKKQKSEEESEENFEDEEEEESDLKTEESINPYELYLNSKLSITTNLSNLREGNYIYGKKTKMYYIFLSQKPLAKKYYLFCKDQKDKDGVIKKIMDINKFYKENVNSGENKKMIKAKYYSYIKELAKKDELTLILASTLNEYTFKKNIKIHYLNYLYKKYTFEIPININWKLNEFINYFKQLYHIPDVSDNSNLTIYINNKLISGNNIEKDEQRIFLPKNFDYEKDFVFIIEHENFDIVKIDLGSSINKVNFKGKPIPHIIFSSYYNFSIESFLVSNQLTSFECEVYIFRDEFYFNLESNVGKNNYEKAQNVLANFNWKNKCKYVTTIKSMKRSSYKNNEDVLSYSIWPTFNVFHDKTYVFLVSAPLMKIKVFDSGAGDQGLFIISNENKCIINGIIGKKLSDFSIN